MPKFEVQYDVRLRSGKMIVEAASEEEAERIVAEQTIVADLCERCELDEVDVWDTSEVKQD